MVYEVYKKTVLEPESFDSWKSSNSDLFDSTFYQCLGSLEQWWLPPSREKTSL